MSLLLCDDLSLAFGPKVLFEHASFALGAQDRVGLLGPNGSGKSSLLKILAGEARPDSGRLVFRRGARVGYLPQDLSALPDGEIVDVVQRAVPGLDALQQRLLETEAALAQASDEASQLELAQELAELHEQADHFEARFGRHRAEAILHGLGFDAAALRKPASALSGGWKMRAALAGLLLSDPDLLLLDEPTNHLDVPTLAWFDAFLRASRKAFVLISHDRDFLNRQVGRVLSLEPEGLRAYKGNHQAYLEQRAVEVEQLLARAERVEQKRAQLQAFVDRFRAKASKASQAQSKLKQLQRLEVVEAPRDRATVSFRFPPVARSGREVATFEGVDKAYGAQVVYRGLNAQLLRGERVAVVGLNGAGKTTLLKLLAGELQPDAGQVRLGHNVALGYYAQHHAETLDGRRTILDEVQAAAPERTPADLRSVVGAFLFSGDDVDKRIGVLSGGERARVALARLLVRPANLLVMDEPTNHLDLDSTEALADALEDYDGTLIFVSHNLSFLNRLATKVWDVRDQQVVPWGGNLQDYLEHLRAQGDGAKGTPLQAAARPQAEKDRKRVEAEARQALSARTAPLKKELAQLEARIAAVEAEQAQRDAQLLDPAFYADFARARPVMDAHRDAKAELERLYARWEAAGRELEEARAAAGPG